MRLILNEVDVFPFLLLHPAALLQAAPSPATSPAVDRQVLAMGTRLVLHLEGPGAGRAGESALAEVERIEAACSTWRPASAWSALNRAQGRAVPLDAEWIALLAAAQDWTRRTGGAFDPALMALLRAWGVRDGGRTPTPEALEAARAASGSRLLDLDAASGTARLKHPGAGVEEGAFLKGYALDAAAQSARKSGASRGWMDFGGQLLAWAAPLPATIADPVRRERPRVSLLLRDASLSTSGCSERGRHILDPATGQRCEAWGSVSVVAPTGFEADVLSTALYVMGPDRGLDWAQRNHVAALFLFNDGGARISGPFEALRPALIP